MSKTAGIEVKEKDVLASLSDFFKVLLEKGELGGVLMPQRLQPGGVVMPTLVADPAKVNGADPLAPAFPLNGARMLSRITRRPLETRVAAVLRPCEIRAFIELVKLKQGRMEDVIIIGVDCLGAYSNADYERFAGKEGKESTFRFIRNALSGKGTSWEGIDVSPACKSCDHPVPENSDLSVGLYGVDTESMLLLRANTPKGESVLKSLGLPETQEPQGRKAAVDAVLAGRAAYRDKMFQETSEATSDLNKLMSYLSKCVNCYNCRVACPVCYCKECVFVTDVFEHEPHQYLAWAKRKGILKMPTDTVFFHLTRIAHMSTACVGCGQCSNACPNHIPIMEIFRTVANFTQKAFGYEAGRSVDDPPPLSMFREKEFSEITGGRD